MQTEHETPEQWGWHREWKRATPIAGWVVVAVLLAMHGTVQYGLAGRLWLTGIAFTIVAGLLWDARRRKYAWRTGDQRSAARSGN
jgi:hypothetical protein